MSSKWARGVDFELPQSIGETGIWEGPAFGVMDRGLAEAIVELVRSFEGSAIVDLGCGRGDYVKFFRECGLLSWGVEGNPQWKESNIIYCCDLTSELPDQLAADWVISIEVGEHIPPDLLRPQSCSDGPLRHGAYVGTAKAAWHRACRRDAKDPSSQHDASLWIRSTA